MQSVDGWGAERFSVSRRVYDGCALFLLMWPATAGMWLLGSTRTWGYAPGLALSLLGAALTFARPLFFPETPRWRVPFAFWPFAALTVWVVAGAPWAAMPYAARWEALRWICLLAAAWAWLQTSGARRRWRWLLFILLLAATFDCLYALVQKIDGSRLVLWAPRPRQYGMRASGTYLCPNHFANVLAMLFPLAIALAFLREAGFALRLMAIYFLAAAAPPLYWSLSRSGWAGALGGLCATGLLLAARKSRAWFCAALVGLPLLLAAGSWTAWKTLPGVQLRVRQVLELKEGAAGVRIPMWKDMPAMIRARPVAGYGAGSFVWAYPPFQKHVDEHLNWDFLHNEYLQMQVEYGAIGSGLLLIGLLGLVVSVLRAILRARDPVGATLLAGALGGLAAALIQALFDFNFHIFPNPHVLVWMGGVAWGTWQARELGLEAADARGRWPRRTVAVAGALACGGCAWLALAGGVAYVWNLKGDVARANLDWEAAAANYAQAIRWDGRNWQPHLGLGMLDAARAQWLRDPDPAAERAGREALADSAQAHLRRAGELNPADMAVAYNLARVHNARGDAEAALAELRRAAGYQRKHVFYREQVGIQLRRMGRDAEALEVFRQNVADGVAGDVTRLNVRQLESRQAREAAAAPAP